jgi:hypothetical protein
MRKIHGSEIGGTKRTKIDGKKRTKSGGSNKTKLGGSERAKIGGTKKTNTDGSHRTNFGGSKYSGGKTSPGERLSPVIMLVSPPLAKETPTQSTIVDWRFVNESLKKISTFSEVDGLGRHSEPVITLERISKQGCGSGQEHVLVILFGEPIAVKPAISGSGCWPIYRHPQNIARFGKLRRSQRREGSSRRVPT